MSAILFMPPLVVKKIQLVTFRNVVDHQHSSRSTRLLVVFFCATLPYSLGCHFFCTFEHFYFVLWSTVGKGSDKPLVFSRILFL